ncbi:MAG: hypothetical protein AAF555_07825 [Verrucomicrobiota bacterium]
MSRPSKTFLIQACPRHFRVDLRKTAQGYAVAQVLREGGGEGPEEEGLELFDPAGSGVLETEWIVPLVRQRPKPAPEITILSDRITSVVSESPGGPGEDWRGAAEMEAQTISGLASSEAVAATTRLPANSGMIRSWIVQAAIRDVAAMRNAVSGASGSRLVSLGHPAGIRLDPTAPQLENWTDFTLFHAAGGERIDLRGWNGPDSLAEAKEDGEVAAALAQAGQTAQILLAASAPAEAYSGTIADFSDPFWIESWSQALAKACDPLTGQILGLPLVSVPKPPPSAAAVAKTSGAIGLAMAVLLGGHFLLERSNHENLEENLREVKTPAERVSTARSQIAELKRELRTLQATARSAGASGVNVYAHRRRIGSLLDGIAAASKVREAVVVDFRPESLNTVLTGAATTFNAPQTLATEIDEALAGNGWRASLVRRTAKLLRPDGGPWSYEIRLTPTRPVRVDPGESPF